MELRELQKSARTTITTKARKRNREPTPQKETEPSDDEHQQNIVSFEIGTSRQGGQVLWHDGN